MASWRHRGRVTCTSLFILPSQPTCGGRRRETTAPPDGAAIRRSGPATVGVQPVMQESNESVKLSTACRLHCIHSECVAHFCYASRKMSPEGWREEKKEEEKLTRHEPTLCIAQLVSDEMKLISLYRTDLIKCSSENKQHPSPPNPQPPEYYEKLD